jgi:hypothetical protein
MPASTDDSARAVAARVIIPNPDPSVMTTVQLDRAIGGVTENFAGQLRAVAVRVDGMEKAATLMHEDMVRVPTVLDREIKSARELLEAKLANIFDVVTERFARVDVMFSEGSRREKDLSVARDLALTNALNAAKEAVAEQNKANTAAITKSEISFSEQLKQLANTADQAYRSINEKIDDVKSRLDKGEGGVSGAQSSRSESRLDYGQLMTFVMAAVALVSLALAFFGHH